MTLKRFILWSASLLLAANCLTGCLAGKFMSNVALKPANHGEADIERTRHKADSLAPGVIAWYDDLHAKGIFKDMTRVDPDGHKLHAVYAPAKDPENAQGTAVVVHGYTDNHLVFMYTALRSAKIACECPRRCDCILWLTWISCILTTTSSPVRLTELRETPICP